MVNAHHPVMTTQRPKTTESKRMLYDLVVFSLLMTVLLVIRDHYIDDFSFKAITSCALGYMVIIFLMNSLKRLTDQEFKDNHPQEWKTLRLLISFVEGLSIILLAVIIMMHFPLYVSLLGQVFQMCILIPFHFVQAYAPLSIVMNHLSSSMIIMLSVLAILSVLIMIRTLSLRSAQTLLMKRTDIILPSLILSSKRREEEEERPTSLGYFYRYASYE